MFVLLLFAEFIKNFLVNDLNLKYFLEYFAAYYFNVLLIILLVVLIEVHFYIFLLMASYVYYKNIAICVFHFNWRKTEKRMIKAMIYRKTLDVRLADLIDHGDEANL